jgi:short-subunit dehydrogenase
MQTIVITGASDGIGAAAARLLAAKTSQELKCQAAAED